MSVCILCACETKPKGVMSKGKMEDVLFDYHLAQSMISNLSPDERSKMSQQYLDAVFEKHGITEADFDSSLVWYNRHMVDLDDIYTNLQERYESMNKELQLKNGNNDMMAVFSTGGDTTNIWGSKKLMVLRHRDILNKESFSIKADTSFHREDTYVLMCKVNLILENPNDRKEFVAMGINVTYKNGKKIGSTSHTFSNGAQQLSITTCDSLDIDKVTGFFYFNGNNTYRSTAILDGIQLIRMHKHDAPADTTKQEPKADSVTVTTISSGMSMPDSIRRAPHLSPAEIRNQNVNVQKIEIRQAPEIRTPNRYGKRRKTKTKGEG